MNRKFAPLALACGVLLGGALTASADGPLQRLRASEAEVRSMPLEKRPNRIGHFYGNNVRRIQQRTLLVNRQHTDRPLARYLYVTR